MVHIREDEALCPEFGRGQHLPQSALLTIGGGAVPVPAGDYAMAEEARIYGRKDPESN